MLLLGLVLIGGESLFRRHFFVGSARRGHFNMEKLWSVKSCYSSLLSTRNNLFGYHLLLLELVFCLFVSEVVCGKILTIEMLMKKE